MNGLINEIQNAAQVIADPNWADVVAIFVSATAIIVAGFVANGQKKFLSNKLKLVYLLYDMICMYI